MRGRILAVMATALLFAGYASSQKTRKVASGKPLTGYSVRVVDRFKLDPEAVKAGVCGSSSAG